MSAFAGLAGRTSRPDLKRLHQGSCIAVVLAAVLAAQLRATDEFSEAAVTARRIAWGEPKDGLRVGLWVRSVDSRGYTHSPSIFLVLDLSPGEYRLISPGPQVFAGGEYFLVGCQQENGQSAVSRFRIPAGRGTPPYIPFARHRLTVRLALHGPVIEGSEGLEALTEREADALVSGTVQLPLTEDRRDHRQVPASAQENSAVAPRSLVDDAARILDELQATNAFIQAHRSDVLVAECAVLRYGHRPTEALAAARAIREPFCASLALGGIAALQLDNDPSQAKALSLEAQERALKIDHWSGPDATSLPYLFELIPLFKPVEAKTVLAASHENLRRWEASEYRKSHAMAALSGAMIAVNPSGVDGLLREASTSAQSNHYFESIRSLGLFAVRTRKEWAKQEAERFYTSGQDWPPPWETIDEYFPLVVVLQGDALADLPKALRRIEKLPEEQQGRAHLDLAKALQEAGRTDEALALLDKIDARTKANVVQIRWLSDASRGLRAQWTAKKVCPVPPEEIDRFLDRPDPSALEAMIAHGRAVVIFRNDEQAASFVERALPLAQGMRERGYPHHGSRRSVALGMLAKIRAMQGDAGQAEKIASEIVIPELKAFYLMEAYSASGPLPEMLREWPVYFYTRTEVRIGN